MQLSMMASTMTPEDAGRAQTRSAEPGYGSEEGALEPTRDECRGLVGHPGLDVSDVCGRVPVFGANWIVGTAHVNGLGAVKRTDGGQPAAPQRPRECAFRIAEQGHRGDMISH